MSGKGETILLVDDEPEVLSALTRQLREWIARGNHRLLKALDATEALETLEKEDIALVITDLKMPGMKGNELLEHVHELHPDTVTIVLSGFVSSSDIPDFLQYNLFGCIEKPWEKQNLLIHMERGLELYQHRINNRKAQKRMNAERERALSYQQLFRNRELPFVQGCVLDLFHSDGPDFPFGGDYWDFLKPDEENLVIFLGDVAGMGLAAAFTSLLLKGLIHGELLHQIENLNSPSRVLDSLNQHLSKQGFLPEGSFVSFTVLFYNRETHSVRFALAGQPPLLRLSQQEIYLHGEKSLPLGVNRDMKWKDDEIILKKGERLILSTNGIFMERQVNNQFSFEQLLEFININTLMDQSLEEMVHFIDGMFERQSKVSRRDEVTLIKLSVR